MENMESNGSLEQSMLECAVNCVEVLNYDAAYRLLNTLLQNNELSEEHLLLFSLVMRESGLQRRGLFHYGGGSSNNERREEGPTNSINKYEMEGEEVSQANLLEKFVEQQQDQELALIYIVLFSQQQQQSYRSGNYPNPNPNNNNNNPQRQRLRKQQQLEADNPTSSLWDQEEAWDGPDANDSNNYEALFNNAAAFLCQHKLAPSFFS